MAFTLGFHIILASLGVALPALMLIANYRGLRRNDPDALKLAQRWSKAVAVTFAVGAVTGTVLSFEFGLLWPAFTGRFGQVFGILFAIEGIFFFLEAIFIGVYLYGWPGLPAKLHLAVLIPIAISGVAGTFCVLAVNAIFGEKGLTDTLRARRTFADAAGELARLKRENAALRDQVHRLRSDPAAIEAVARGELGLVKPGEILVTIKDVK